MLKELFRIPLKIANIPFKVVDNLIFDGDDIFSCALEEANKVPEAIGEAIDDAVSDLCD